MASDSLTALKAAGFDVDKIPEAHRGVLDKLSTEEVKTLVSIKERMDAATEVETFATTLRGDGYVIY